MPQDSDPTVCVFRRWKSDRTVIAIFPFVPAYDRAGNCMSFEHIGQHAPCNPHGLTGAHTMPCDPGEPDALALRRELESEPYNYTLDVRHRMPRWVTMLSEQRRNGAS